MVLSVTSRYFGRFFPSPRQATGTRIVGEWPAATGRRSNRTRQQTRPCAFALSCDNFPYDFKGAPPARQRQAAGGLDKGTLAAAHIGLVRAGQKPPDRRTAYGPPPLIKPPCSVRAGLPGAGDLNAKCAAMTTRATAAAEMTGTARAGGVGKCRALPGGSPTGAASRPLAAVPASRGPVVAHRYAPTGTGPARKAAVDGCGRAVRVQQWTAIAGPRRSQAGTKGRQPRKTETGVAAGEKANSLIRLSGQGRGRTADLPLFRRTLIPTELPDLAGALPRLSGPDGI